MDANTHDAPALSARLAEARIAQPQRAVRAHHSALVALLHANTARGGRMRAGDESPPPSDEEEAEEPELDEDEDEPESDEDAGATTAEDAHVDNVDGAAPRMSAARMLERIKRASCIA
jgi:hypothetical protein